MSFLSNRHLLAVELDCNEIESLDLFELGLLCRRGLLVCALFDVCLDYGAFFSGKDDGCDVGDAFFLGFTGSQLRWAKDGGFN